MNSLRLFSEQFARTGNIAAEGFLSLLGRPGLGQLQTLIREGLQNVLDASVDGAGPRVRIRLRTLDKEEHEALRDRVLAGRPAADLSREQIGASLSGADVWVLELCDFGTEGLSGPTRADLAHDGREPPNFINFMRNVGAARDTHQGGGTYGYGKSAYYAVSACSTIVVDTRTRFRGESCRRFMACHLGAAHDAFVEGDRQYRFTGRHWWGVPDGDDSVEPAMGDFARSLSSALGMPPREPPDTGTSVLIVDPVFERDDMASVVADIVEAVLWNFWPRMTASTPADRRLRVEVECDGEDCPLPAPEDFPPLDLFTAALEEHRRPDGNLRPVTYGNARVHLGDVAIRQGIRSRRDYPATREGSSIPQTACHVALMRPVGLVVRYLEGMPLADTRFEWAGVFVCSDDDRIEAAFARAEPPAHDDWVPDNLPQGDGRSHVKTAMRKLTNIARKDAVPGTAPASDGDRGPSLAATATRLGALLSDASSAGPGRRQRNSGSSSGRRLPHVSKARFDGLHADGQGQPVARFLAELENDGSDEALVLVVEPYLVMDGGATSARDLPPDMLPAATGVTVGDTIRSEGAGHVHVGHEGGTVCVTVPVVRDAAIGLRLNLRSGLPE